jgi:hypothetical protein
MASKGNKIESWEVNPATHPPNANVTNAKTMTSPEAQAARAKSAEIMAALKKGDEEEANRLMGPQKNHDSLIPGMAKLKAMITSKKDEGRTKK